MTVSRQSLPTGLEVHQFTGSTVLLIDTRYFRPELVIGRADTSGRTSPSDAEVLGQSTGGRVVIAGPLYDADDRVAQLRGQLTSLHPHYQRPPSAKGGFVPRGVGVVPGSAGRSFAEFHDRHYDRFDAETRNAIRHLCWNVSTNRYQVVRWSDSRPPGDLVITGKAVGSIYADRLDQMVGFVAVSTNCLIVVQSTLKGGRSGDFVREVVAEASAVLGRSIDPAQGIVLDDGISRFMAIDGQWINRGSLNPPHNVRFCPVRAGGREGTMYTHEAAFTGHSFAHGAEVPPGEGDEGRPWWERAARGVALSFFGR